MAWASLDCSPSCLSPQADQRYRLVMVVGSRTALGTNSPALVVVIVLALAVYSGYDLVKTRVDHDQSSDASSPASCTQSEHRSSNTAWKNLKSTGEIVSSNSTRLRSIGCKSSPRAHNPRRVCCSGRLARVYWSPPNQVPGGRVPGQHISKQRSGTLDGRGSSDDAVSLPAKTRQSAIRLMFGVGAVCVARAHWVQTVLRFKLPGRHILSHHEAHMKNIAPLTPEQQALVGTDDVMRLANYFVRYYQRWYRKLRRRLQSAALLWGRSGTAKFRNIHNRHTYMRYTHDWMRAYMNVKPEDPQARDQIQPWRSKDSCRDETARL